MSSNWHEIYTANAARFTQALTNLFLRRQNDDAFSFFKGSITHSFPETDPNSAEYVYGRYEMDMRYRKLSLNTTDQLSTHYLSEEFQADCRSLNAEEIIEKYGTHALTSLFIGAKLNIDFQAEYTGNKGQQASENSFKVGLLTYFEALPSVSRHDDFNAIKGISNPVIAVEALGGDPSHIKVDSDADGIPLIKTVDWKESITEENATFVHLDGLDNLIPISEFISDIDKKHKVEAYINAYIQSNQIKLK